MPLNEMAMILTLDQLSPNPDNPRKGRNPRYDDIKSSIKSRGLDTVPKVTRDPDGDDTYIFSDGGNTRYQILAELWQETGDERFYRIHCLFKPWPGRLHCVIGHLAENDMRGDLTFIEKAQGVHKARTLFEDKLGKKITLRELSKLLSEEGFPVHYSSISKMEDALSYLYPHMPTLLEGGMGRGQIESLLLLRSNTKRVGKEFFSDGGEENLPIDVFSNVCTQFDSPELFSLDVFRDELIGELIKDCPHVSLNYDRWLFELDPKTQPKGMFDNTDLNQTQNSVEDELKDESVIETLESNVVENTKQKKNSKEPVIIDKNEIEDESVDFIGDFDSNEAENTELGSVEENVSYSVVKDDIVTKDNDISVDSSVETLVSSFSESLPVEENQLVTLNTLYPISPLQDDIEHLQAEIFRSVFSLADGLGISEFISQDNSEMKSAGFKVDSDTTPSLVLLKSLSGDNEDAPNNSYFCNALIGLYSDDEIKKPDFNDEEVL
nr:ParB family protein [Xenorhabdus innexi]